MKTRTERTVKSLLDRRRAREQDLALAVYVAPQGSGLHRVRMIGSTAEILVSSVGLSITYAPGETVLIGTLSGRGTRVLLGSAPPGAQGGSAFDAPPTAADRDALAVVYAIPGDVPVGEEMSVDFIGWGLDGSDAWSVVTVGSDGSTMLDPLVQMGVIELLDPAAEGYTDAEPGWDLVRVTVTVDAAAPVGRLLSVRVARAGVEHVAVDLLRTIRATAPDVGVFLGLIPDYAEGDLVAFAYSNGVQGDEIARQPMSTDPTDARWRNWQSIHVDSEGAVGVDSLAWCTGGEDTGFDTELVVWDLAGSATYTYAAAAGFEICGPCWEPSTARLYWVEWEVERHTPEGGPTTSTLRLRSALADLSDPQTVATTELDTAAELSPSDHAVRLPRVTRDHAYCLVIRRIDGNQYSELRWPIGGGDPSDRSADFLTVHEFLPADGFDVRGVGVRTGGNQGSEYYLKSSGSGSEQWFFYRSTEILEDGPPVAGHPLTEAWSMTYPVSIDYLPGSGVLIYGADVLAIRAPITSGEAASPLQVIAPTYSGDDPPIAFFYRTP